MLCKMKKSEGGNLVPSPPPALRGGGGGRGEWSSLDTTLEVQNVT